jgi:hypothetical protein
MFPVFFRQGFFPNNQRHDFNYFIDIFMPPLHKAKVLYKLAGEFRNKHCLVLQGLFQMFFQFFPGLALCGVYENGAGDFPPRYGIGFLHGGQGYSIGGMLRFPAMGANIAGISPGLGNFDVFYGICGVHTRLLTLNYTPFWKKRLFQLAAYCTGQMATPFGLGVLSAKRTKLLEHEGPCFHDLFFLRVPFSQDRRSSLRPLW